MAYHGGYAGGYADTLVPPTPTDVGPGIWQPPIPPRETRVRTRLRYRLTITGSGAHLHVDPEPITIDATIGGDRTHHHNEPLITATIESAAKHEHAQRANYEARLAGRGIIPDPDEWLVFL